MIIVGLKAESQTVTFNGDVAPIIFNNCTKCHRSGEIAPFALTNYAEVAGEAASIYDAINNRRMPPWAPDPSYNHLAFERTLSAQDIQKINSWISSGLPEGNSIPLPPLPDFDSTNNSVQPNFSYRIPEYTIQSAQDIYRCFVVPTGWVNDKKIKAIQVIPGNKACVHHVQVFWDTTQICNQLDGADSLPGYTRFIGTGSDFSQLIHIWVPGSELFFLPSNFVFNVPAGAKLIFQIHYAAGFAGEKDSTRVNIFTNQSGGTTRGVTIRSMINYNNIENGQPFVIPANQVISFNASDTLNFTYTFLGIFPHMHLLGKSMKSYAITPSNDTVRFSDIPEWKFYWQNIYQFTKAIKIPAGTSLHCEASYDNTVLNSLNPHNPPETEVYGEESSEEMLLNFFLVTAYHNGDENIIIDSSFYFNNATQIFSSNTAVAYPNPTEGNFMVDFSTDKSEWINISISDLAGRVIRNRTTEIFSHPGKNEISFSLDGLSAGVYFLSLSGSNIHCVLKIDLVN